jgi:hypothetical protein
MCHNDKKRHSGKCIGQQWNSEKVYGEITVKIDCTEKIRLHFAKETW